MPRTPRKTAPAATPADPRVGLRPGPPLVFEELEVEGPDPYDFVEFLTSGALPLRPRPAFEAALAAHLRARVRERFSH